MTGYKKGDLIEITCDGRTVEGVILMASSNSISLMIGFEAILHGHLGKMPVLMSDDLTSGQSIIDGTEVFIRKRVLQ